MVEDMLMNNKNSDNSEVGKKDTDKKNDDELPSLIQKNLKSLLKHVESNGYTKNDLIRLLKKGE
jgi:hypothetical protein